MKFVVLVLKVLFKRIYIVSSFLLEIQISRNVDICGFSVCIICVNLSMSGNGILMYKCRMELCFIDFRINIWNHIENKAKFYENLVYFLDNYLAFVYNFNWFIDVCKYGLDVYMNILN